MYARIMNFRIPLVAASEQGTAQTVWIYSTGLQGFNVGSIFLFHFIVRQEDEYRGRAFR